MASPVFKEQKDWYTGAMEHLVEVVQELSLARDLSSVMKIVRQAARDLTGADGATFVLRDGDYCYYADENAISPLWKGQRFPMRVCISGWVMMNAKSVVIEDIDADPRIPIEAYRPTFVRSLAMVPIRQDRPIGAIGNYWATKRMPLQEEVDILQALANVTAVTMENIELAAKLKSEIKSLENANAALNRFAWIATHDLKSPLRAMGQMAQWIDESLSQKQYGDCKEHIKTLQSKTEKMEKLLDDILEYAQLDYILNPNGEDVEKVNGDVMIKDALALIGVPVGFDVQVNEALGKLSLPRMPLQQIFHNLIGNAIVHNNKKAGFVAVDVEERENEYIFSISDNGPGIESEHHEKIFEAFQVLKGREGREGNGMGLALVKKMLDIYGGSIMVDSIPGRGSVFRFVWPRQAAKSSSSEAARAA
jgi:signal transduction histidine kinase